ncbi:hypothetical protein A5CBH24_11840 [Alistipes communis]|uniref:BACON domain-containing protein n=1 Tax=Alistipes communis TaxID=2585118 RepID=A0A4Y1WS27_9BACT|nr:DUF4595 domain-containing protein [Alistipes communis]BBL03871.1 hypothetical protein A5CBH24_11840 [Alistipes communis]
MKKFHAILSLMGAIAFIACSNDNGGEEGKDIQLAPGTSKDYTIFADETSGTPSEGISFTTTGPWRATVAETRADVSGGSSWVTVSPDHGDAAGDYTITITLGVNTTGKDRRATVMIECGGTKITITVEQKGTTEEGEIPDDSDEPAVPARLLISEMKSYSKKNPDQSYSNIKLTYDDQNRITKWEEESSDEGYRDTRTITFEYGGDVVHISSAASSDDPDDPNTYTAYLNKNGFVTRTEGPGLDATTYEYDSENRLVRMVQATEWQEYVWKDGNLTEIKYGNDDGETDVTRYTYYGELENRENFDIFYDRISWDEELAIAGLTGIPCRNLLHEERGESQWAYKDDFDMTYEVDGNGYITKAVQTQPQEGEGDNPWIGEIKHIQGK